MHTIDLLFSALGTLLLAILVWDVHATVFVPYGPAGPLARRFHRSCWRVWHRLVGHRTPQARRRLAQLGPTLIPMTIILWGGLLLVGYMLLLLPHAGALEVGLGDKAAFPPWFNAFYVTAYSISTLGIGDVVPNGGLARVIMVAAAGSGFVLITIAITYIPSVYSALERMTALAFEIHRFIGRSDGQTPVDVVVLAVSTDSLSELSSWLASTTTALSQVVQADDEFPLLHFFHMPYERALPLALADLLEVVTLCRTLLSPEVYPALTGGLVTAGTERVVQSYFLGLVQKFHHSPADYGDKGIAERLAAFVRAWNQLEAAGLPLRPRDEAYALYTGRRSQWDQASMQLREHFGYPVFEHERYVIVNES
ncbi:potassium channel family protein [Deinococcus sp.]|uniref:potassium channel family protein n=1 Tax=Deinococcus sp. TaxID=47478 RepID=UPI0025B90FBF|nr:potassium channel family protein [Deinococcus sp.]